MQGPPHGMLPSSMKSPSRRPLSMNADDAVQAEQQKPKIPVLEKHLIGQLSKEEQDPLEAKFKEASEADKKVCSSFFAWEKVCSSVFLFT
jgi:epidermal growth factor receptor substrate 15